MIVWGSNFSVSGNQLIFSSANGEQTIVLNESDGLYFWDQSSGQINAALDPRIAAGVWYVSVQNSCIVASGPVQTFSITVN